MAQFAPAYGIVRPLYGFYNGGMIGYSAGLSGLDAAFAPAYGLVRKHEGYYLNDPKDVGGETYAGIARKIWPSWHGWVIVDFWKKRLGRPLRTNEALPPESGVEDAVAEFYEDRWNASRAGQFASQDVANIYFDFYILASKAVATLQQVLNNLGQRVTVDNIPGPQLVAAVNAVNPARLYQAYKDARVAYHYDRVNRGLVDAKFLPGWLKRTYQFPDLLSPVPIGLMALGAAGIFIALHKPTKTWISKQLKQLSAA